jgi:hypothetical protein
MSMSETKQATKALVDRKPFHKYERKVRVNRKGTAVLYMFNYPIAAYTKDKRFFVKKPSIIDNSFVIRAVSNVMREIADASYWYWRGTIDGYSWDGEWIEIINTGTVTIFNKQSPFKLEDDGN